MSSHILLVVSKKHVPARMSPLVRYLGINSSSAKAF